MATTLELCERIELRLQQVLNEVDRLTRALDALGPSSGMDGRAHDDAVPAAADAAPPPATKPTEPPRRPPVVARRLGQDAEAGVPVVERAVLALRAELHAGLRTTAGV